MMDVCLFCEQLEAHSQAISALQCQDFPNAMNAAEITNMLGLYLSVKGTGTCRALVRFRTQLNGQSSILLPSYGHGIELPGGRQRSLINGYNITDVMLIEVNGTVDGQGLAWCEWFNSHSLHYSHPYLVELCKLEQNSNFRMSHC